MWRRFGGAVCALALCGLVSGCAQAVPGRAWAEGEGPAAGTVQPGEAPDSGVEPGRSSPPTSFTVPGPLPGADAGPTTAPGRTTSGAPTTIYPMPFDDPPPGLAAPATPTTVPAPAPGASASPRRPDRTVTPHRSRGTTARTAPAPPPSTSARPAPRPPAAPARPPQAPSRPAPSRPVPAAPLTADVVPDECLLDRAGFAALLGVAVAEPANHVVTRPSGTSTRSCFAAAGGGSASAAVNIYRVNAGSPAAFLHTATGARPFAGAGDPAVLVDTVGGPTLQLATPRYLVTIAVAGRSPAPDRWRAAGRAAVTALGGR